MMRNRAVSEVLGYSLVFSLVIFSVAVVSVGGLAGYQNAEDFERQSNSQKAFDVLHNNLEDVYYQSAPSRGTEIDLGETGLTLEDPIVINVTVEGASRQEFQIESQPIVQDLGDDNELVYEAGAVFQTTRDGGIIRQRPPMVLRGDTAHIIAPNVRPATARSVGSGTVLIRAQSKGQEIRYRNTTRDPSAELTMNVTSPRSDLWYGYLTDRGAFDESDCQQPEDDVVVCGPVSLDQVTLVEPRINIVFDR
ncbi:MAG: hypothetical protein V5A41_12890 [Haloarculaceae archaeon]